MALMGANKKVIVETEETEVNLAKRELVSRMQPRVNASSIVQGREV